MRYACTSCGKEREIATSAAWPTSCECGGTSWKSPEPLTSFRNTGFDPARTASDLLRQPGSALDSFRNGGATATLT